MNKVSHRNLYAMKRLVGFFILFLLIDSSVALGQKPTGESSSSERQLLCEVRELRKLLSDSMTAFRRTLILIEDLRSQRAEKERIQRDIESAEGTIEPIEQTQVQLRARLTAIRDQMSDASSGQKEVLSGDDAEIQRSLAEQAALAEKTKQSITSLKSELRIKELEITKIQNALLDLKGPDVILNTTKATDVICQ